MSFTLDHAAPPDRRVRSVLVVCTGNVCRSPFAALLLRARAPGITVTSAGIAALEGEAMESQMATELAERQVSPVGFRARQVIEEHLRADLVLTMSDRQRRYLIEEFPRVARRVGRLGDIAGLAAPGTDDGGVTLGAVRQWTRSHHDGGDIPDPYRRDRTVAASVASRLEVLVAQLARALAAEGGPT